ncbi:MAG: septum formation initiator family protein [Actinomycetota bacterium]|nr:septum formation initiator family protein [Actinomycetota bacterium]
MSAGRPSTTARVRRSDSRRPVLSARAGAALGVVVVLITILAIPFREWITQGARISELESQVAWHNQRVADLQTARDRWKDPAYVEAQARARLHFVRPGEVGYVVLTDETAEAPETTQTRPMAPAPKGGPWWSAVWSTVAQAADPAETLPPSAPEPAEPADTYGQ